MSDVVSESVWHVASFATVGDDGLLTDLLEVWADSSSDVPADCA